jgi:basic membrane lipoprotein Med (substrate-binding protein (PBP1-ABC) superfamily)
MKRPPARRPEPAARTSWWRRRTWWIVGAATVAVGACVVAAVVSGGESTPPPVRARRYTAHQVCLLTGPRGISAGAARTVWAGMQDASLATRAKVSYLPVIGPATAANALTYANTLVARDCDLVIATGAPETAALRQASTADPATHFLLVSNGPPADSGTGNLRTTTATGDIRGQVRAAVENAVRNGRGPR